jgi:tetratricopeptide (TPR) repeat protein
MTSHAWHIVRAVVSSAVMIAVVGWFVVYTVRKAEDPARMVFKWCITLGTGLLFVFVALPTVAQQSLVALHGLSVGLICSIIMVITWRRDLAGLVANPIAALYDGGNQPPELRPMYSVALARQKSGHYPEAIAEVRKQLERFPNDVEGQFLLAQIQAEDLKDMPAAETTIQQFCAQPGHAPQNMVFALYSLADWHLKIDRDREAARRALERILEVYPDSEFAPGAAHRLANLENQDLILAQHDRHKYLVAEGVHHIGLLKSSEHLRPTSTDLEQQAAEYVKHLEQHPLDTEAREKLAIIYADHYGRLDLATDQLEQLIQEPNQPAKLVVHWLNLLADLQVRCGAVYETVKETLQRIIDRDPNLAAAEMARNRLARLKLEIKARQKSEAVKLGTYEQNIGLKAVRSRRQ